MINLIPLESLTLDHMVILHNILLISIVVFILSVFFFHIMYRYCHRTYTETCRKNEICVCRKAEYFCQLLFK